jgi:hypothetical protein
MITCANCDSSYGGSDNFGFLKRIETIGADSYYFTVQKSKLGDFERDYVEVGKELQHGEYYLVKCVSCTEVVGRKLVVPKNFSFIIFDKEKLLYESIQIEKSDSWASLLSLSPFNELEVFEIEKFKDANSTTQPQKFQEAKKVHPHAAYQSSSRAVSLQDRSFVKKYDQNQSNSAYTNKNDQNQSNSAHAEKNDQNQSNSAYTKKNDQNQSKSAYTKKNDHNQRSSACTEKNDHNQRNSGKTERDKVGNSATEMVEFLRSKRKIWPVDQIIHEFSGANKMNWKAITDRGVMNDDGGKVLYEIFHLLSLQEVRDSSNASELYTSFSETTGLMGIMTYLSVGVLKDDSLQQAVSQGRGGKEWLLVMGAALSAVQTIHYVMEKFECVKSHSCMLMIIEVLWSRITTLVGNQFAKTETLDGCARSLSSEDKCKSANAAKYLVSIVEKLRRMREASSVARIQKSQEKDAEEKEKESKVAKVRHRGGISFQDDPSRDRDYLLIAVTPTPADLLSPPPTSLPENHVEKELSTVNSLISVAPQLPYRDQNHYLNTQFSLGLEDCVAQLRRGLKSFRGILSEDPESAIIIHPLPDKLNKACLSFCRSRDSGAYIYGDVKVDNVDGLRDGIGYVVSFNTIEARKVDWTSSSRFMNGSLLCLSKDGTFNAESMVVATVMRGVQVPKGNRN